MDQLLASILGAIPSQDYLLNTWPGWAIFAAALYATWQIVRSLLPRSYAVFDGTAVVITGAGRGIGRRLAHEFAPYAPLVLMDVNAEGLEGTWSEVCADPRCKGAVRYVVDVSSDAQVKAALESARTQLGLPMRIIVSNAAVVNGADTQNLSEEAVRRSLLVNVGGSFNLLRHVLPDVLNARAGCLCLVASLMGFTGAASLSDYCASKWAVMGLVESLRQELGRDGLYDSVGTVAVAPYHVASTPMFRGILEGPRARNPLRTLFFRALHEEEVAHAIFKAVCAGGHHVVFLPWMFEWLVPILRLVMPLRVYDFFVGIMGGWHGMDSFRGVHHMSKPTESADATEVVLAATRAAKAASPGLPLRMASLETAAQREEAEVAMMGLAGSTGPRSRAGAAGASLAGRRPSLAR
jgi:all-trans-retinol dehydrogenase (NAD+)